MYHLLFPLLAFLTLLAVGAFIWLCLEYRSAQREERYRQENQQYSCDGKGHGYTYEPLSVYVSSQGHKRFCARCAAKQHAIPARASLHAK